MASNPSRKPATLRSCRTHPLGTTTDSCSMTKLQALLHLARTAETQLEPTCAHALVHKLILTRTCCASDPNQQKRHFPTIVYSFQHTMSAPFLNEYFTSQCPASAPFFSFMGAAIALVFASESFLFCVPHEFSALR